jgi:hypothetical protein
MRIFEHVTDPSGYDFSIGADPYAIATGVYNPISMCRAIIAATAGGSTKISLVTMNTSVDCVIKLASNSSKPVITWQNTDLRDALGFSGATTTFSVYYATAPYLSPYIWLPEHHFADQSAFTESSEDYFIGTYSMAGAVAGVSNGDVLKKRTMKFNFELATNLWREFCTDQNMIDRCLESFVKGALCAAPTVASNPCSKGFWLYPNVNDLIADCTSTGSEWGDSGDIDFALSSSPDTYVFCNFVPGSLSDWRSSPGFPVGRLRYHVSVSFVTAPAPSGLS